MTEGVDGVLYFSQQPGRRTVICSSVPLILSNQITIAQTEDPTLKLLNSCVTTFCVPCVSFTSYSSN